MGATHWHVLQKLEKGVSFQMLFMLQEHDCFVLEVNALSSMPCKGTFLAHFVTLFSFINLPHRTFPEKNNIIGCSSEPISQHKCLC